MNFVADTVREEILRHPARFKTIVAGRRWGKTHLALMWLMLGTIRPGERRWFVTPTYKQGKMVAMPILRRFFRNHDIPHKLNESDLSVTISDAEIAIKGADNEDNLRGAGNLTKVVMDEFDYQKPHVFQEIILPMLADTKGEAMFIGTPDGFKHFYDVYQKGLGGDSDWKSWQFTTLEGGFVDKSEVLMAKATMDERLFKQEFLASFETAGNRAAYNFDRKVHVKEGKPSGELLWGVDFNVDYMTAELACQYTDGTVHFFDEIRLSNSNTFELSEAMKKIAPDVPCYPDPAGSARSTTSSRSDHAILREAGFSVIARKKHPAVRDRLNSLNRKLRDANGKIGMTVSPRCKYLISDLERCQRDKSGGLDKSDIALTHALDACSYLIEFKWPVISRAIREVKW